MKILHLSGTLQAQYNIHGLLLIMILGHLLSIALTLSQVLNQLGLLIAHLQYQLGLHQTLGHHSPLILIHGQTADHLPDHTHIDFRGHSTLTEKFRYDLSVTLIG